MSPVIVAPFLMSSAVWLKRAYLNVGTGSYVAWTSRVNTGLVFVGKYPTDVTMILLPLCVQLTWYCPPPPEHTVDPDMLHGLAAERLWPNLVMESLRPASATVSALLHSIAMLDCLSEAVPASRPTTNRMAMIASSSIAMTRE